jgi:lipid A ethanolaminephosphotransferase
MLQTNIHESMDLLTIKQVMYLVVLGLIPAFVIYKVNIEYKSLKDELFSKIKVIISTLIIIVLCILIFSKHYTSFFREHKPLRYSVNPVYWIYSIGSYVNKTFNSGPIIVKQIGLDARVIKKDKTPKLVIMVVGEAARADHFSLNGYKKNTNPLLSQDNIINMSNVYSCGTSTAVSVPCMFSIFPKEDFDYKKGITNETVLDVLDHTKDISILWRDNNSDSKGVALRVPYEDYRTSKTNKICTEGECRDIGMLEDLDKFIAQQKDKDVLIVLHQMGNHGPAYYKRYTKDFEIFTPTCKTNQLEKCTQEEISNAYDNAILYTDNFLHKTIEFLKQYDNTYKTAMIYMADHGESLGENGLYLHGLPYFMAPDAQIHIGSILWFGNKMQKDIDQNYIKTINKQKFSQDNLFHTLLGIFNINTKVYDKNMDIIKYKD